MKISVPVTCIGPIGKEKQMFNVGRFPGQWRVPLLGIVLSVFACIGFFWETWASIVAIWIRSETFAHGFLVAPISLWLIWTRRALYRDLPVQRSLLGWICLLGCGFMWLTADLVHVLVVRQWAVVGILISSIWAIIGNRATGSMLFPLFFLILMVPFGEDFVPYLMEYTATFAVGMLRLSGLSVYREGLHFSLTSGNWSVVDACSGIRYLIASMTLGAVYSYLNYTNYYKRAVFLLASVLVPILANGMRAYLIVMIGHLSNLKLATGFDHLIYGWLFFGLIMVFLFYAGTFWHDPPPTPLQQAEPESGVRDSRFDRLMPVAVVLGFSIWPAAASWMVEKQAEHREFPEYLVKTAVPQWQNLVSLPDWGWQPEFNGVAGDVKAAFAKAGAVVVLYETNFGDESHGELVNSQNVLIREGDKVWQILHTGKSDVRLRGNKNILVDETLLSSRQRDLLVFRWYRVGAVDTANNYYAKWLQLMKRLTGDAAPELLMIVYTETPHGESERAKELLRKFAEACCG